MISLRPRPPGPPTPLRAYVRMFAGFIAVAAVLGMVIWLVAPLVR